MNDDLSGRPMPMAQALRWIGLLVLALLAMTGVQHWVSGSGEAEPARAAAPASATGWGPSNYSQALNALDREVARGRARIGANPDSWAAHESLAIALHARGQLTGSHEDLAAAMASADTARSLADPRSGPVLSRAAIALSLHRNDIAADEAARLAGFAVPPDEDAQAEAAAILGDAALYSGDYAGALEQYRASMELYPNLGSRVRLADWLRHHGDFDEARRVLEEALDDGAVAPWTRAQLLLQLGAIDLQTGDWQAAEEYFEKADAAFPCWWLARAHLAQMAAVRGDFAQAEALYREALTGAERPSVMDALAAVLAEQGRDAEAERLAAQASALWKARVASHPEAYADHAFEAFLMDGDSARSWQLARLNYVTRPYGDGRIGLARAAAARGRDASARAVLEELARTGWRSTEQNKVLAEVCERLGDAQCVSDAREAALAISPLAFDARADLLFFSNH